MKNLSRLILLCLPLLLAACDKSEPKQEGPKVEKKASTAAALSAVAVKPTAPAGPPLRVAYSDWPGWVAWDIAVQKGWFKEAGVEVDFKWFEYVPSMEAYSAGKVDAVAITNGDALVTGSSGGIGSAVVKAARADGFAPIGVDLDPPERPQVLSHFIQGDVTASETIAAACAALEA